MRKFAPMLAAIMAVTLAAPAFAQSTDTPRIDKRQAQQQKRINKGKATGQITPREAQRLEKGQETIGKMEEKAESDGNVTPRERRKIERAQDQLSKKIAKSKHNKNKK